MAGRLPLAAILTSTTSLVAIGAATSPAIGADIGLTTGGDQAYVGRTVSGTVDFRGAFASLKNVDFDSSSQADADYPLLGGKTHVDIPFDDVTSFQLDIGGEYAFVDPEDSASYDDNYQGSFFVGGHVSSREMERYLFGAFGGGGVVSIFDDDSTGDPAPFWFAGVEGQLYHRNSTLYGQLGWVDSDHGEATETLENAVFVRGVARHFMNGGGTKVEGELSFFHGTQDDGDEGVNIVGWGAEIEHQFKVEGQEGFLAGYARVEGLHFNELGGDGNSHDQYSFLLGLRADFHQGSLFSRDRAGATLDLPNLGRVVGGTTMVDPP